MNDSDITDEMWMGIAHRRRAMRGPAGVGDADIAGKRVLVEHLFQIEEFAFGAAAVELAVIDRGDAAES